MAQQLQQPFPVIVHPFHSDTISHACLYELLPGGFNSGKASPKNVLLFIGGLGDGPHTVPMIRTLAEEFSSKAPDWSVFEIRLSSSFNQWGFSDLESDVKELDEAVDHLKSRMGKSKVVLMGHSTGCQDCVAYSDAQRYSTPGERPLADGFILQGPVSDREYNEGCYKEANQSMEDSLNYMNSIIKPGEADKSKETYMPRHLLPAEYRTGGPITVYRWHSLITPMGDDDFFSSDLSDDHYVLKIWGRFQVPLLIVPSEKDECVPSHVDKAKLLEKWMSSCKPGVASELSGLVPGASHCVDQPDAQLWLADRITRFFGRIE